MALLSPGRVALWPFVIALAGCVPEQGELAIDPLVEVPAPGPDCSLFDLDDARLPTAVVGAAYSGRVRVAGYDGAVMFLVAQGTPPSGLSLALDGTITGVPTRIGTWELWLRARQMTIADAFGCVQIRVSDLPDDAALGYVHDQRTAISEQGAVQQGLWVRVIDGGEPGMDTVLLRPGFYRPGPNGVPEQGGGDDELIRLIDPKEVEVEPGAWVNADGEAEDSPSSYSGQGLFSAGADTGTLPFTLRHPDVPPIDSALQTVPPDWCPAGLSAGPGDGSCQ